MSVKEDYEAIEPRLLKVQDVLYEELTDVLKNSIHIDQIKKRVKSLEKFLEKTERKKYSHPLKEMQDQIGFRIVVYYKCDVEPIAEQILKYFTNVENKDKKPETKSFGYEGRTIIARIPHHHVNNFKLNIDFFEIQICTLFQHAWAEAEHDLGYKSDKDQSDMDQRRMAWAAAQAWGADLIFNGLKTNK